MATFSTFRDDFFTDYGKYTETAVPVLADNPTDYNNWDTVFTHLFDICERNLSAKFDAVAGETINLPGNDSTVLPVPQTITGVTKVEYATSDTNIVNNTYTEIATSEWKFVAKDRNIQLYDFSSSLFYYYKTVDGNIRLTVNSGYATWDNFPQWLQSAMLNAGRAYFSMLDSIDNTVTDEVQNTGLNFEVLNNVMKQWGIGPIYKVFNITGE